MEVGRDQQALIVPGLHCSSPLTSRCRLDAGSDRGCWATTVMTPGSASAATWRVLAAVLKPSLQELENMRKLAAALCMHAVASSGGARAGGGARPPVLARYRRAGSAARACNARSRCAKAGRAPQRGASCGKGAGLGPTHTGGGTYATALPPSDGTSGLTTKEPEGRMVRGAAQVQRHHWHSPEAGEQLLPRFRVAARGGCRKSGTWFRVSVAACARSGHACTWHAQHPRHRLMHPATGVLCSIYRLGELLKVLLVQAGGLIGPQSASCVRWVCVPASAGGHPCSVMNDEGRQIT